MQTFARELANANKFLHKRTGSKNTKKANMVIQITSIVNVVRPMPGEPHTHRSCDPPRPLYHPVGRFNRHTKPGGDSRYTKSTFFYWYKFEASSRIYQPNFGFFTSHLTFPFGLFGCFQMIIQLFILCNVSIFL